MTKFEMIYIAAVILAAGDIASDDECYTNRYIVNRARELFDEVEDQTK